MAAKADQKYTSIDFLSGGNEMAGIILNKDWSETDLGDIAAWPQSLRTILSVCLSLKSPAIVFWGQELTVFFNDAFRNITPKNISILGKSGREVWSYALQVLESVINEGKSILFENKLQLLERKGYTQESYFTYSHSPVYIEDGKIGGIFTLVNETTETIIAERRNKTLKQLTKRITQSKTIENALLTTIKTLESNKYDITSAVIYQIDKSKKRAKSLYVEGFEQNSLHENIIDLNGNSPRASYFLKCVRSGLPVYVSDLRNRIGDLPRGAWESTPMEGAILPIRHGNSKLPTEILAVTLNPHLKLDQKYKVFLNSIVEQIQSGIAVFTSIEHKKKLAEAHLKAERELNNIFARAPIAICILRGKKHIIELVNEKMSEILRISKNKILGKPLFEVIKDSASLPFKQMLNLVHSSGTRYIDEEYEVKYIKNEVNESLYLKFAFEPIFDETGKVHKIIVVADEITENVLNRKNLEESKDQLKIAIEAAELGTYTWESPQPALIFSDRLAQLYGYMGSTNITQADLQKSVHPDDLKILSEAYEISKKTGLLDYECRLIWPDKSMHWIHVRSKIILNEKSVPIKLYGTAMDITLQKKNTEALEKEIVKRTVILQQTNEDLKKSEERYQKITEEVKDYAIILLSRDGTILNWNQGAAKIKGYKEHEIIGKNFDVFYSDQDKKDHLPQKLINEAITYGRAMNEGYRIKKNGQSMWANTVLTALHNNKKEVIGFSKITRDLTERKRAEDKLQQYTEELEFQNKELEQFAYIASHDLQEPLRVIQMYAQLYNNNPSDAKEYFAKIQLTAQRMQELIKSVLNYSRLNASEEKLIKTDLNTVLAKVKSDFELMMKEKNSEIINDYLPTIKGKPIQLHQLFSNLISNSLKFSKSRPVIHIRSHFLSDDETANFPGLQPYLKYIELTFSDNGIGFKEEYGNKIFEVFQRLHEKQEYSGTGIGLALCKKIVANHHGHINAKSKPGKGSTFYVYLPVNFK